MISKPRTLIAGNLNGVTVYHGVVGGGGGGGKHAVSTPQGSETCFYGTSQYHRESVLHDRCPFIKGSS